MKEIESISLTSKKNFIILIILFLNFFLFFAIVIFILLFSLLFIYNFIIIKTLNKIENELKTKINEKTYKELLKKKIDNLNCLLKFYDNDINKTINKLNKIYDEYKDSYNMKIKEELKILKREGKKQLEKANKNFNYMQPFSTIKKHKLYKYLLRKKSFLYLCIFIIILTITIYLINLLIWIFTFKKESKIMEWKTINDNVIKTTNKFLSSYFLMIFDNQTLDEISMDYKSNNFIYDIFSELATAYSIGKYDKYINNDNYTNIIKEKDNCLEFYKKLENDIFIQLHNKFINEEKKFITTMNLLCEWVNIFNYNNYKAIYLKFFNLLQNGMELYNNAKYTDLINYINKKDVIQIDIIYLNIIKYIIDIVIQNNKEIFISMMSEIGHYIGITNFIVYPMIIFLIFVSFLLYIKIVNIECKKFIHIRNIFKICNMN